MVGSIESNLPDNLKKNLIGFLKELSPHATPKNYFGSLFKYLKYEAETFERLGRQECAKEAVYLENKYASTTWSGRLSNSNRLMEDCNLFMAVKNKAAPIKKTATFSSIRNVTQGCSNRLPL